MTTDIHPSPSSSERVSRLASLAAATLLSLALWAAIIVGVRVWL